MFRFLKIQKNQIIIALTLLLIAAASKLGIAPAATLTALCLGPAILADLLFAYLRRRTFFFPRSGIITGLILTLIIDTSAIWYQVVLISVAAMAIKNFIRPGGKHIFNPAASGLLIGWLIFGLQPSWWAPSPYSPAALFSIPNIPLLIPIALIGYVSLYRYRRYFSVASYGTIYFILLLLTQITTSLATAASSMINIGTISYAFLMLVEPMTTPIKKNRQLLFGVTVAVLTISLIHLQKISGFSVFDVTLTALLLSNLLFFRYR